MRNRYLNQNSKNTMFQCNNGSKKDTTLLNDLVFDCGSNGEDEPLLIDLLNGNIFQTCEKKSTNDLRGKLALNTRKNKKTKLDLYRQISTKKKHNPKKNLL